MYFITNICVIKLIFTFKIIRIMTLNAKTGTLFVSTYIIREHERSGPFLVPIKEKKKKKEKKVPHLLAVNHN